MNIAKPKRKRTRSRSRYYADRICGAWVVLNEGCCATCGTREQLQPGHYIGRSIFSVRFDVRNLSATCPACNLKHESNPEILRLVVIKRIGGEEFEKLLIRAGFALVKLDYDSIMSDFRDKIVNLRRFKRLSSPMQKKVLAGTYTNTALLEEMYP